MAKSNAVPEWWKFGKGDYLCIACMLQFRTIGASMAHNEEHHPEKITRKTLPLGGTGVVVTDIECPYCDVAGKRTFRGDVPKLRKRGDELICLSFHGEVTEDEAIVFAAIRSEGNTPDDMSDSRVWAAERELSTRGAIRRDEGGEWTI